MSRSFSFYDVKSTLPAILLHICTNQNHQHWAASCVSTQCKHIHRPSSTKGVFVLHFLSTSHRQECLRGKQQWLAGAPRLLLASCPSRAGTQPGASHPCQMGHWSSKGRLAAQEEQSRTTLDLQPCQITINEQTM